MSIGSQTATVNGQPQALDVPAQIAGGRTLVPLRFLGSALGAQVGWDGATQTVTYSLGGTLVTLQFGQTTAQVNGQTVTLDVAP